MELRVSRFFLTLMVFSLLSPIAFAQSSTVTLPFTQLKEQNWILVSLRVNNHPGTFILDTGGTGTVVSRAMIFDAKERINQRVVGINGAGYVDGAKVTLTIGKDSIPINIAAVNLDAISKHAGRQIDGILGMDVLGQYSRMEIDFKTGVLTLEREGKAQ